MKTAVGRALAGRDKSPTCGLRKACTIALRSRSVHRRPTLRHTATPEPFRTHPEPSTSSRASTARVEGVRSESLMPSEVVVLSGGRRGGGSVEPLIPSHAQRAARLHTRTPSHPRWGERQGRARRPRRSSSCSCSSQRLEPQGHRGFPREQMLAASCNFWACCDFGQGALGGEDDFYRASLTAGRQRRSVQPG